MATNKRQLLAGHISAELVFTKLPALFMAAWFASFCVDRAASQPVVNGTMTTDVDEPLEYKASGRVNTSAQWGDNPPPQVEGPWYDIPAKDPLPAGGAHWEFSVRHSASEWGEKQVTEPRLWVKGRHIRVPVDGHNEGPNNLPPIGTPPEYKKGKKLVIQSGKKANVSTWGGVPHEDHWDGYYVVGKNMVYGVAGAVGTLGFGEVKVGAFHTETLKELEKKVKSWRIGASLVSSGSSGGSTVNFDADSGTLSFLPGRIDVLDLQGGLSGHVDPRYAADPILDAQISVSDLTLEGRQTDGRYRFSGGTLSIADEVGQFVLTASFDEYIIGDTSQSVALDSFGVLSHGESFELVEEDALSTFLGDFVDDHLLGRLPTSDSFPERAIDLAFITGPDMDLATLTDGFTTSAFAVPADIYVGGNGFELPDLPQPGDYNGDGIVDHRDYAVWKSEFGAIGSPAGSGHDGVVDAAGYNVWRDNLGPAVLSLNTRDGRHLTHVATVPEPGAATLVLITMAALLVVRRGPTAVANW